METVLQRCAGLDIHQRTVVATVRVPAAAGTRASQTATFGTMTVDLLALRDWLQAQGVARIGHGKHRRVPGDRFLACWRRTSHCC